MARKAAKKRPAAKKAAPRRKKRVAPLPKTWAVTGPVVQVAPPLAEPAGLPDAPPTPLSVLPYEHQRFVLEWIDCHNAKKAYIRAGYAARGHSAEVNGAKLLHSEPIQAAIKFVAEEAISKMKVTAERIIQELTRIALSNHKDFVSWDEHGTVTVVPSNEISTEDAAAIAEISHETTTRGIRLRVKYHDKIQAAMAVAKLSGWVVDKVAPTSPDGEQEYGFGFSDEDRGRLVQSILTRLGHQGPGEGGVGAAVSGGSPAPVP